MIITYKRCEPKTERIRTAPRRDKRVANHTRTKTARAAAREWTPYRERKSQTIAVIAKSVALMDTGAAVN